MYSRVVLANNSAVSELVGGMLIVGIAVIVSISIYMQMLPVPIPPPEPNAHLMGYITDDGTVVIEHMGGETLFTYEIFVNQSNGTTINKYENTPWEIGQSISPPGASFLMDNNEIKITVYSIYDDNSRHIVFDGILKYEEIKEIIPKNHPMLISSLRTDSVDEDLICYNYSIESSIDALSYIYNWLVKQDDLFTPIANMLLPFDSESMSLAKDYSSNNYNGTIYNADWENDGKVGGAYNFSGTDYISIPYCFESNSIEKMTVEAWIKTSLDSGTILSYDRSKYCEAAVSDGMVKWSTNASDGTKDIKGNTIVSDGQWHHITTTYNSSTGNSGIYVDGILEKSENIHAPGLLLGSGVPTNGSIGKGTGTASLETIFSTSFETQGEKDSWSEHNTSGGEDSWENLFYDDFEGSIWGNWIDGGGDCLMYTGGSYAYQGSCAINIRDNSGWASSTYTNEITAHIADYTQMSIDFMWIANSMENGEDFWVNYYDGTNLERLKTIVIGTGEYSNNVFYHTVCFVNETDYTFTDEARFTLQCDASGNDDNVYLDKIYVNVSVGNRPDYDFDLRDSGDLNPRTGFYSIGGSGDFDPDYAAFNRTSIDITGYSDVSVSIWYSYKDTEDTDFFGFYYQHNDVWTPIFEIENPQIGSGQTEWTQAEVDIPEDIDNLVFQFKWMTSSSSEYVAVDDLEIKGFPPSGENNFTGLIDEIKIYEDVLSAEQIFQNYLYTKDGDSSRSVIVSEETSIDDNWKCIVTPNDGLQDDLSVESNVLTIISYTGGD